MPYQFDPLEREERLAYLHQQMVNKTGDVKLATELVRDTRRALVTNTQWQQFFAALEQDAT